MNDLFRFHPFAYNPCEASGVLGANVASGVPSIVSWPGVPGACMDSR